MFKPDQPIESARDDLLGRSLFSRSFAEGILYYKQQKSVVTALYGRWGSGKSSVLNMIVEHISSLGESLPNPEKPIVVRFNPWNYSDQNQLIAQFFRELSLVLKRRDYGADAQKVGKQLEVYSQFFIPLALIDPTGFAAFNAIAASKVFQLVGSATKKWGDLKSRDLTQIRTEIDALLAKQSRKILIVIDDIDRLNSLEIRQIFQLVKILGDFPNTVYLLAFDQTVIAKALQGVQKGLGAEYLEKIVQIPFELPSVSKQEVEQVLSSEVNAIIKDLSQSKWDETYSGNVYQSGVKYFFETLRDVTRFFNSFRFGFSMVKDEVNPVDFFAITALHVFEPGVYSGIRDNKDLFSGILGSGYHTADVEVEQARRRCDEILSRSVVLSQDKMKELLSRLFPKLESIYGNMGYGYDFLDSWRRTSRVSSPDRFDIYFKLSLPKGELSQSEIEAVLSLTANSNAFAEALLKLKEDGRVVRFLQRFEDYTGEGVPEQNIEQIVTVLMDIGDSFQDDREVTLDTPRLVRRICYQLCHRFSDQAKRFEILNSAITNASESIFTVVHEVGLQAHEHGKFPSNTEHLEPEGRRTVNSKQLEFLEKLACDKINNHAEQGRLSKHTKLLSILYSWRRFCPAGAEEVQTFVKTLVEIDEGLVDLVSAFVQRSIVTGVTDYVSRVEWSINLNSVNDFVPVKEVEPRIRQIVAREDFQNLSADQQKALTIFLDTLGETWTPSESNSR
jgi:predicted KAP-like P-loop ATPase